MRAVRRSVSIAASLIVLALPAAALAQTPGDDQYTDPFGGDNQEQPSSPSQDEATPTQTPQPAAQAPTPTATPVPAPATTSQTTTDPGTQLPRTGGDPLPVAVAGFWLLLGGVALRARVRPR